MTPAESHPTRAYPPPHYNLFVDRRGDHNLCPNLRQDIKLSNPGQSDKGAGVTHHIQGVFPSPRLNLRKVSKSFSSSSGL